MATTNILCNSFSEKLSSLHTIFESLLQQKEKLERELQLTYGKIQDQVRYL